MMSASKFWTKVKREQLRAWGLANPATDKSLRDSHLHRLQKPAPSALITAGALKGFRMESEYPDARFLRSCFPGGDRAAVNVMRHHGGWYTNNHHGDVVFACCMLVRVPRRRAKAESVKHEDHDNVTRVRWVEATEHSFFDQTCIDRKSLHPSIKEALWAADSAAERFAQVARNEDAKDLAESKIQDLQQAIADSKDVINSCHKELEEMCSTHLFARGVLVERIQSEEALIAKKTARIAELQENQWKAVA
jgi:hypothetical protein